MKIKTSELTGAALDWAVAKCEGMQFAKAFGPGTVRFDAVWTPPVPTGGQTPYILEKSYKYWRERCDGNILGRTRLWVPSSDWAQGGPIIEREGIHPTVEYSSDVFGEPIARCGWRACAWNASTPGTSGFMVWGLGETILIAAMRCYVASKLGDEVEIPEELA